MADFTFTLPKAATKKGIQQVGGKYNFKDGKLTVSEDVARKIKKVLVTFHGCTVSQEKSAEPEQSQSDDENTTLSKTTTQAKK